MGETTGIAWTNHTFNIAWGCFKVSPGCKNCYADTFATNRVGLKVWGPPETTERRTFGEKHWREPRRWNRDAEKAGVRTKVFTSSMCDIFEDHPTVTAELAKLWALIRETPWIDWQLLTKRAARIEECLPSDWGDGYPNVWLGVSVENQEYAELRIPLLLQAPAVVRFVSYEPALGPIDFTHLNCLGHSLDALRGEWCANESGCLVPDKGDGDLSWVIYGGESGPGFRPEDKQWARDAYAQCKAAGVAFFHKQSAAPRTEMGIELDGRIVREYPR